MTETYHITENDTDQSNGLIHEDDFKDGINPLFENDIIIHTFEAPDWDSAVEYYNIYLLERMEEI